MSASHRTCVCPGSFDPVTAGHLDVVVRAAALFDEVVVAVLRNPAKPGTFDVEQRCRLLTQSLSEIDLTPGARVRVEVVSDGLLVDFCTRVGASAVVKGLRGGVDFGYELPMALMNRRLSGVETVFVPGDPALVHVSSSLVKEVAAHGGDVTGLVPTPVLAALQQLAAGGSG